MRDTKSHVQYFLSKGTREKKKRKERKRTEQKRKERYMVKVKKEVKKKSFIKAL